MVASIRPDSWNLPLFLHVFGAMLLFGGTIAALVLALAAARRRERGELARATFRTLVFLVLPAWVLTRVFAQVILDKENVDDDATWVGIGFAVTEPGLILLLIGTGIAFWATRRRAGWHAPAVAAITAVYAVALAVAWLAMSAKWGT